MGLEIGQTADNVSVLDSLVSVSVQFLSVSYEFVIYSKGEGPLSCFINCQRQSATCFTNKLLFCVLEKGLKMSSGEQYSGLKRPLIHSNQENLYVVGVEGSMEKGVVRRSGIVAELKKQLRLAGPLISVNLLQYCLQVISIMFVGHLGDLPLSGASMAMSFGSATGFNLLMGMGSALDTFCGQSYGAKQYHMLGFHMQRGIVVLMIVSIPLAFIWAYTGQILLLVGQNPDIAAEAGKYARFMIPCLFAYGLLQCHVRFLQAQNIVFPMVISSGITTLLHILLCWILVIKSGLGSRGAALATSISYWINVLFLALYVKLSNTCKKSWNGFSKEALHDVFNYIQLAFPSAVMFCMEMWSFNLIFLLSGLLPNPKLETSALSVSLNTDALMWIVPFGFGGAVSTRVSNELGAGHPQAADFAVQVVLFLAVTEVFLIGLTLILVCHIWGYAYRNEEEINYLATMVPLLVTSNFLYLIQAILSGTIRGCGWQKIGAYVDLGAYYLVGIPSAILLAFVFHIGGKGLWLGTICALVVELFSLLIITMCTNWEQEAKKAKQRVYDSTVPY